MARTRNQSNSSGTFECPECGRTFSRAAALGAHRRQAHGIAGQSARARANQQSAATAKRAASRRQSSGGRSRARGRADSARTSVDRDVLLRTLFPAGIPAKEGVIRAVNSWLDEAESLAKMK